MKFNFKKIALATIALACVAFGYRSLKKIVKKEAEAESSDTVGEEDFHDSSNKSVDAMKEVEEEEEVNVKSSFFEEAISLAIEEQGVDPSYFRPSLEDDDLSLSPTIKISRFFDRNIHREARKLDILFPIPISIAMSKMDMGKYQYVTNETKLPGPSVKQINPRLFWSAFNFKNGYVIDQIIGLLPCLESHLETDIEGYYFVNYFMKDRETSKYVFREKIVCGVNYMKRREIDNAWEGKNKYNEALKQYLTEVFEKYVLDHSSDFSNDIIDPYLLEKGRKVVDIDIDYVILCHRVSFIIADDNHPIGITPYQMSLLFKYLEEKLEISDGLPSSNKFKYKSPTIYDEDALYDGRFAVYVVGSEDEDNHPRIKLEQIDEDYIKEEEEKKNSESEKE